MYFLVLLIILASKILIAMITKKFLYCISAHFSKNGSVCQFIINFLFFYKFPATHKCSFNCWFVSTRRKIYTKKIWTGGKILENQPLRTFWEINHSANSEKTIFSTKKSYMHRSFQEFIFKRLKNLTSKSWKLFTSSILCLLIHFQTVAMCWTHLLPLEKICVSFL